MKNYLKNLIEHIIEKINYGYKENIYRLALCYELESKGYKVQREVAKDIFYDYKPLGYIRADIILNNEYVVEMKSIKNIKERKKSSRMKVLI